MSRTLWESIKQTLSLSLKTRAWGLKLTPAIVFLSTKSWCNKKSVERWGLYNLHLGKVADLENPLSTWVTTTHVSCSDMNNNLEIVYLTPYYLVSLSTLLSWSRGFYIVSKSIYWSFHFMNPLCFRPGFSDGFYIIPHDAHYYIWAQEYRFGKALHQKN